MNEPFDIDINRSPIIMNVLKIELYIYCEVVTYVIGF